MDDEKRHTAPRTFSRATGYGHIPAANTQRTRSKHPPRHTLKWTLTHPPVTRHQNLHSHPAFNGMRRLTQCRYTERAISPKEVILRPSLKYVSVRDGPYNKTKVKIKWKMQQYCGTASHNESTTREQFSDCASYAHTQLT
ncbi:hypothetical protein TcCL_NonESM13008 [Trypanosoma cruzi]|nr:hypothetical protein TcCL_NonESM13008 [Trypanosoma cruzi]